MSKPDALLQLSMIAEGERALREQKPSAIAEAIEAGCNRVEIAAALGCTRQALYNYLARRR